MAAPPTGADALRPSDAVVALPLSTARED